MAWTRCIIKEPERSRVTIKCRIRLLSELEEHDDMDSLNKNMTEMIQQSAMSIAKQTKKQKTTKMSSPTRALVKKRREMIENNTPRDHIEYVEICKNIKKKAREDIRKHNLDEIRETIEASKSLKKVRRKHNLGKTG